MGRPVCSVIPESLASGQVVLSLGSIGNWVYTNLGHQECYSAIPGAVLEGVCAELSTILDANEGLADFHRTRRKEFSSACLTFA